MITFQNGNMFAYQFDALINPVNCKGVMGKGLALEFKKKYPQNFMAYRKICDEHLLQPGSIYVTHFRPDPIIINFATKDHWKNPSKIEYIQKGMQQIVELLNNHRITSIAIPKIGCGLGGLNWEEVLPIITDKLQDFDINITIFGENTTI